ncbi:MAG: hypothetical protein NXI32_27315, partial [bacterium]|nr:hypothetical protein [bacterium]
MATKLQSLWLLMLLGLTAGANAQSNTASTIQLNDFTTRSGIHFTHSDGSYGQYYLVESMSGGLALVDFDRDGDLDIYLLNGARIPLGSDTSETIAHNALYR